MKSVIKESGYVSNCKSESLSRQRQDLSNVEKSVLKGINQLLFKFNIFSELRKIQEIKETVVLRVKQAQKEIENFTRGLEDVQENLRKKLSDEASSAFLTRSIALNISPSIIKYHLEAASLGSTNYCILTPRSENAPSLSKTIQVPLEKPRPQIKRGGNLVNKYLQSGGNWVHNDL